MFVFIDESGDPGFKIAKGSSPIFVAAMVLFLDARAASQAQLTITELSDQLKIRPEFKFNKCKDEFRDAFFEAVSRCQFTTRAVVVRKDRIYSPALREVKESFYKFFVRMMMQNDGGMLNGAKVVIDGSGDREFKRQFRGYLKRHVDTARVREVELKDSRRDPLLQLADMAAGAIARSYRTDRQNAPRWRNMLEQHRQIGDIWEFR